MADMVYKKIVRINLKTGEMKILEDIPMPDENPEPYLKAQAKYYASALLKAMEKEKK